MATSGSIEPVQIVYDDDDFKETDESSANSRLDTSGLETLVSQDHPKASGTSKTNSVSGAGSSASGYQIPNNIDVNNPAEIIELLENVDLSEEDTETLLQEAYKMNRKLKEILRRQEAGPEHSETDRKQKNSGKSSTTSASRSGSAFSHKTPLPPISLPTQASGIYNMKLKRSTTNIPVHRQADTVVRAKSTKQMHTSPGDGRGSPTRKSRSKLTEHRPEWNDRFSYS